MFKATHLLQPDTGMEVLLGPRGMLIRFISFVNQSSIDWRVGGYPAGFIEALDGALKGARRTGVIDDPPSLEAQFTVACQTPNEYYVEVTVEEVRGQKRTWEITAPKPDVRRVIETIKAYWTV